MEISEKFCVETVTTKYIQGMEICDQICVETLTTKHMQGMEICDKFCGKLSGRLGGVLLSPRVKPNNYGHDTVIFLPCFA